MSGKNSGQITLRQMIEEDIEAVALIEAASFTTPWTAQGFADALQNPNAYCLVAEQQESFLRSILSMISSASVMAVPDGASSL